MKINIDGTFEIEKGEVIPFVCPKCKFPTEFSAELLMVKCNQCGYMGDKDEFSSELLLNENT